MKADERVIRDVENGDHECSHCGGDANSTLGGEHIWKCSEVVPNDVLEDQIAEWRDYADGLDRFNDDHSKLSQKLHYKMAAELEELID